MVTSYTLSSYNAVWHLDLMQLEITLSQKIDMSLQIERVEQVFSI